jgi:hypothetical protein
VRTGKITDENPKWKAVCSSCAQASYGGCNNRKYSKGVTPFITGICENIDGHLGWICFTNWDLVPDDYKGVTEIDHKDGDSSNNELWNLQELCIHCHSYKGQQAGDYNSWKPSSKRLVAAKVK